MSDSLMPENWAYEDYDLISTQNTVMMVHGAGTCAGQTCVIHNPSQHVLVTRPLHWNVLLQLMERVCVHGNHHPDPDAIAFLVRDDGLKAEAIASVHFGHCDGCCNDEFHQDEEDRPGNGDEVHP